MNQTTMEGRKDQVYTRLVTLTQNVRQSSVRLYDLISSLTGGLSSLSEEGLHTFQAIQQTQLEVYEAACLLKTHVNVYAVMLELTDSIQAAKTSLATAVDRYVTAGARVREAMEHPGEFWTQEHIANIQSTFAEANAADAEVKACAKQYAYLCMSFPEVPSL